MLERGEERRLLLLAAAIVAAVTLFRIAVLVASPLELYPDEAQYWWWAQTPDIGYFSKPPLIAWIIRAATGLFGNHEWSIRLAVPLLHAGAALLSFAIARSAYPYRPRIALWSALAYLTLPGVSYSCGLASTDAPLLFFWALALFAFLRGAAAPGWRWPMLCGVALGLGCLSKYAMIYFPLGAILAAAAHPEIRKQVLGRNGLLALAVAVLIVAPNLAWNALHEYPTVDQLEANARWSRALFDPVHLAGFLAGQFGVFGPVLMAAWLAALWRLARGAATPAQAALAAFSIPSFALIALQAFVADANANWAATAYVSAVPLAIAEILERWPRVALWGSFALHGLIVALLGLFLVFPPAADRLGLGNVFKRQEGWRDLAGRVAAEAKRGGFALIAADNRSVTAELLYYMPPGAPPVRIWDGDQTSHNHFEMTIRLEPSPARMLLVVPPEDAAQIAATFESIRPVTRVVTPLDARHARVMCLYDARGYRGPARTSEHVPPVLHASAEIPTRVSGALGAPRE